MRLLGYGVICEIARYLDTPNPIEDGLIETIPNSVNCIVDQKQKKNSLCIKEKPKGY